MHDHSQIYNPTREGLLQVHTLNTDLLFPLALQSKNISLCSESQPAFSRTIVFSHNFRGYVTSLFVYTQATTEYTKRKVHSLNSKQENFLSNSDLDNKIFWYSQHACLLIPFYYSIEIGSGTMLFFLRQPFHSPPLLLFNLSRVFLYLNFGCLLSDIGQLWLKSSQN